MIGRVLVVFAALGLAGCEVIRTDFPVTPEAQGALDMSNVRIVQLGPDNIHKFTRAPGGASVTSLPALSRWEYLVGPGDILDIVVWDHPELTLPAGPQRTPAESGNWVRNDGTFFYPFIGEVKASGRSLEDIRGELAARLAAFIPDPQVEVRVAQFNSQAVQVTGEVLKPGRQRVTNVPVTLLEAIDASGGLKETADARRVTVSRTGKRFSVDLKGFLDAGVTRNNPILRGGDVVNVPRLEPEEAFLLGEIDKPGPVDLSKDTVSLTQALTRQGGLRADRADARGIFVFRGTPEEVIVYQLDARTPVAFLLGARFVLHPRDVVFVTRDPATKWNEVIGTVLPTVQALAGTRTIAR